MPYELSPDSSQTPVGALLKLEAVKITQSAEVWCAGLHFGLSSNWKKDSFVSCAGTAGYLKYWGLHLGQAPLAHQ